MASAEDQLRQRFAAALELDGTRPVELTGSATLDSAYPVSDLATAAVATVALAAAELCEALGHPSPTIAVDRTLVDTWFGYALSPVGWTIPSPWDAIAGDYPALPGADGRPAWIRLHTNAPHHRAAALRVLGVEGEKQHVAAAVARWDAHALEAAVVAEGGCAAVLRSPEEWAAHPQGSAVAAEPLVVIETTEADTGVDSTWNPTFERPLAGLRVLDLTRVLSGPVATRMLAGLGADVLRIDAPDWDEPAVVPDMTIGKRAARLDLRDPVGRDTLLGLLASADVFVSGYRSDALENLGLGEEVRRSIRPGLVDVSLDAYGFSGPWANRRGFDSLVQMSTGIAGSGLQSGTADRPTPLPVQALDHGTGYLVAAAALAGLARRVTSGEGTRCRLSLARTAAELESARHLVKQPVAAPATSGTEPVTAQTHVRTTVGTPWGAATLPPPPLAIGGVRIGWERGPRPLGSDAPAW